MNVNQKWLYTILKWLDVKSIAEEGTVITHLLSLYTVYPVRGHRRPGAQPRGLGTSSSKNMQISLIGVPIVFVCIVFWDRLQVTVTRYTISGLKDEWKNE